MYKHKQTARVVQCHDECQMVLNYPKCIFFFFLNEFIALKCTAVAIHLRFPAPYLFDKFGSFRLNLLQLMVYFVLKKIGPEVKGEIKADAVDVCSLPPVNPSPIECSGVIPRWTYNAKTGVCDKFVYGGCFGTENLFKNEFACLAKCNKEGKLAHLIQQLRFIYSTIIGRQNREY